MTLGTAAIALNCLLLGALLPLLLWKRIDRVLPTFITYLGYSFFAGLAALALSHNAFGYRRLWCALSTIDTLFYLCVLVELGKAVLRYNRASALPSGIVFLLFI